MASTLGSPTMIGWKRRSSAASFSTCLRYSSSVVAPMARSSPRASIGLSRLAASTAPSAAPAPTIVCSSSMNRITWPSDSWISLRTALRRSSNSPRYLEPASRAPMSSAMTRRSWSDSGTSPSMIRWARPSTIAVLPTPGSPISTGLFFVRRERTWMTRRISSSRPMTGSSLPFSAASVRSRPKRWSDWYFSSGFWSVTRCGPRIASIAFARSSRAGRPSMASESASSRCSVDTYSSPSLAISRSAARRTSSSSRAVAGSRAPAVIVGSRSSSPPVWLRTAAGSAPTLRRTGPTRPSSWSSRASSRCCGAVSVLRAVGGKPDRGLQRLLGLDREAVELHSDISVEGTKILACWWRRRTTLSRRRRRPGHDPAHGHGRCRRRCPTPSCRRRCRRRR